MACKSSETGEESKADNLINTETIEDIGNVLNSKKDAKVVHSSRPPRERSHSSHSSRQTFSVQQTSSEQEIDEREEEDLLSLSPQPSIISTVTHGATKKKNSLARSDSEREKISYGSSSTEAPVIIEPNRRVSSAPRLQFGDVLFGSRTSQDGATSSQSDRSEHAKSLDVINSSHIESQLLDLYPGVPKVLDDSLDEDPLDSFYYVSWDHDIYDQFDDFGQVLEEKKAEEEEVEHQKSSIRVTYSAHHPARPPPRHQTGPKVEQTASKCRPSKCKLPDCQCGGTESPANFSAKKTPQIVVLTFDDSVNDLNKRLYQDIFHPSRKNPNGCPIAATFYVSHEWTDYALVQSLYSDGHEIASHSISHSFGEQFSKKKWMKEMAGQREILAGFAGIKLEDVRGIRAPFLAIGGNNMFSMLYEANFTYDSSMPIYDNKPPTFPYTMDYKLSHDCMIPPCPNKAYPGVWELPLVMWNDLKEGRCSMADACSNPASAEGVYYMIMKNFQRHYNTNRAPFLLSYHPAW